MNSTKDTFSIHWNCKIMEFTDGTKVLDIGTGGGFQEFLWLFYFQCGIYFGRFYWQKITVVNAVAESLGFKKCKSLSRKSRKNKR